MKTEQVHTVVLGAGPSGLAAGYVLAKAGLKPVVLEKDKVSGGLMRSLRHGDFILDVGRKELYNRLEKVDTFWSALLKNDYREYQHRGGILFDGHIIDMSPVYKGFRRGMPWSMFLGCCLDFFIWRARLGRPRNLEEYWYHQRGRQLTRIANQGFQEKLVGRKWADIPLSDEKHQQGASVWSTIKHALRRAFSGKETNTFKGIWRHPAKGTGQICEALERGIIEAGGRVLHQVRVLQITGGQGRVESVTAEVDSVPVTFQVQNLVSSTPAEFLEKFLLPERAAAAGGGGGSKPPGPPQRVVVLVYLFMDEPPQFPHFWLQVTCPKTRIGRIANYAALNADMVPPGKSCICCEIYCFGEDPLLKMENQQIAEMALEDCARSGLLTRSKCFDKMVLRFPGADASQNRHNWLNANRQRLLVDLGIFRNLYSVNRTDLDIATVAGLDAAEAIISGDRSLFDRHFDPTQLGIRSESKPLEFRHPAGLGA